MPGVREVNLKLKIMKLACVMLIVLLLLIHPYGHSQTITCSGKNIPIEKLFSVIKKQTGYFFFHNNELLKNARKIDINVKNATLKEVLAVTFKNQPFDYVIENKTIVITKKAAAVSVKEGPAVVRNDTMRTVSGSIQDQNGKPVSGATITVSGTTMATSASSEGTFTVKMPLSKSQLVVSSIGFEDAVLENNHQNQITVVLKQKEYIESTDVIVVGYGTAKKIDLTGSVSTVNIRDIGDRQNPSLATLVQGKISGVDVNAGSIRIRGITSFNNTEPLVVIDGFLGGSMETVNPNDIEGIEVLKDASSTSIYGARGANGVVLITTRQPKAGPTKIYINVNSGFAVTPKKLDVLNASEYVDYVQEGLTNAGQPIPAKLLTKEVRVDVTDWQDEVFKPAHSNSVDINFSGGSERSTFYVSMGYKKSDEIFIGPQRDEITTRLKNNFTIRKWLRFGDNFAFAYRINKGAGPTRVSSMINMQPYIPARDDRNYWGYGSINRVEDLGDAMNPVATSGLLHPVYHSLDFQANIWAEIEPVKNLKYHVQYGATGSFARNSIWTDKYDNSAQQTIPNSFSDNSVYSLNPIFESFLTYNGKKGNHDLTVMAGNSRQNYASSGTISIYGQNYANTDLRSVFNAESRSVTGQNFGRYAFTSYFGRINYQYANRYLLTLNVRRDGSPRFAPQNRWGTFPSVGAAWKLHEEDFFKSLGIFDQLKVRTSWGISGNDAIGDFKYLANVWTNGVYYPFGNTPAPVSGATILDDAAADIKWESTVTKNIGLDLGLIRNALTVTAEYFIKDSKDILFTVPRPLSLGYGLMVSDGNALVNAASCTNKGYEIQVGYRNSSGALRYFISANYSRVKNNVTSLGLGAPYMSNASRTEINNPIGFYYGYTADGIFETRAELDAANQYARQEAKKANPALTLDQLNQVFYLLPATSPGDVKFKDLNGDGKISPDKDRSKIGNSIPTVLYAASIYLDCKNWDLNVFIRGIAGSQVFYNGYEDTRSMEFVQNQESVVLNRWKSEEEPGNGKVPRAILSDPADNTRPSTLMVFSGNYFKVQQLSFGYSLPDRLIKKIGFAKLRFYGSGNNLLTFSKVPGYDPEFGGANLTRGQTFLNFPVGRSISIGLQAGL